MHIENALAVADAGPVEEQSLPDKLSEARIALVANRHFVLEKINLQPESRWALHAKRETWVLVLEGHGRIGAIEASKGEVVFIEDECIDIAVGPDGLEGLLAYTGPDPDLGLLAQVDDTSIIAVGSVWRASVEESPGNVHKLPEVQA